MLSLKNFVKAFKLTIPIFFGYISIGIPFGLMVAKAGFPWYFAALMGIFIYSGTAQFVAIAYFASRVLPETASESLLPALIPLLFIEFIINFRHIFYGISLLEKFRGLGKWKPFLIYSLSDETFAIFCSTEVPQDAPKGPFYTVIALLNQSYWIIGGIIGAFAGNLIPAGWNDGVDFALVCLFGTIMIDQIKKSKDFWPSFAGVLTTLAAIALAYIPLGGEGPLIPEQNIILTGLCLGITVILVIRGAIQKEYRKIKSGEIEA